MPAADNQDMEIMHQLRIGERIGRVKGSRDQSPCVSRETSLCSLR
jgi:hypothetical protein